MGIFFEANELPARVPPTIVPDPALQTQVGENESSFQMQAKKPQPAACRYSHPIAPLSRKKNPGRNPTNISQAKNEDCKITDNYLLEP
jgi:hypothetical protein